MLIWVMPQRIWRAFSADVEVNIGLGQIEQVTISSPRLDQ